MQIDSEDSELCQLLLQRAGRGDATAFAGLYDRTAPAVYGLIRSVLPDVRQADDVTLEVYRQTWRVASRFDPDRDDACSLLMATARRYVLDKIRSAPSRDGGSGPAHPAVSYAQAMAAVPVACREVLGWSHFGGQPLAEVAKLLGIPVAEAVSRLNDALTSLREAAETRHHRQRDSVR
ncbi:sigma factor [Amycolatopsis sp. WQ 127309]|uniref:sigma factor n=1 Tax=Amycolatopsis sp. WQ 127309 TaxID=2932773 RepID=UPI001FF5D5A8|nr:sigma factor [Amycolatopsis sp. WQ 127309]UOZ03318.1 hypothetical protein MUY22_31225 [Amycolatopsis sp. WQ 127309]